MSVCELACHGRRDEGSKQLMYLGRKQGKAALSLGHTLGRVIGEGGNTKKEICTEKLMAIQ